MQKPRNDAPSIRSSAIVVLILLTQPFYTSALASEN